MKGHEASPDHPAPTTGPDPAPTRAESPDARTLELAEILEGYLAGLEAGNTPDRARLLAEHPHLAASLEEALAGLDFIRQTAPTTEPPPERLGDFRIIREVGRGGMGVVYEAEQVSLKRRVALKVLRLGPIADETAMQRFQREAETIARLHHTHIVPIHAIGCEQGVRYYAMQFIDGEDLGRWVQRGREHGTRPAVPDLAQWGLQAAEALAHAHERGVIHRDIKPSNLILDREGRIWLSDFGLARRLDDTSLSLSGALLGTPRYMSPEQASAAARLPVDHRTDIYSLGATLYELATGQPIFDAAAPHQVIAQILHQEPKAPRRIIADLPRDLETIILKCLGKEPAQRYATAGQLAADLRAFREHRPIAARRSSRTERTVRWLRRHRRAVALAGVSAVLAVTAASLAGQAWNSYQRRKLGQLQIASAQPNLLAEILDARGNTVVPLTAVPHENPQSLPAGNYQLRLSSPGVPSESWPLEIRARELARPSVVLPQPWMWTSPPLGPAVWGNVELLPGSARLGLLAVIPAEANSTNAATRLRLIRGADGRPGWNQDLVFDESTVPPGAAPHEWRTLLGRWSIAPAFAETGLPERCADLDGDGVGDPVVLSRSNPSLVAVSGATGQVLWWHRGRPELPADLPPGGSWTPAPHLGSIVGTPLQTPVDADAIPDLVACFRSNAETYRAPNGQRHTDPGQSWLGAVSGRDGSLLWRQPLSDPWSNYSSSSGDATRFGPLAAPRLHLVDGRPVIVLATEGRLAAWDPRTGSPVWGPLNLGFELTQPPALFGLGAAKPGSIPDTTPPPADLALVTRVLDGQPSVLELAAIALPSGEVRWRHPGDQAPSYAIRTLETHAAQRRTFIRDSTHSTGNLGILVQRITENETQVLEVESLDPATGNPHWIQSLRRDPSPTPTDFTHLIGTEDTDGDGVTDVLATYPDYDAGAKRHGIRVILLSGANGQPLWNRHHPGLGGAVGIRFWATQPGLAPRLLLSTSAYDGGRESTLVLDPQTGVVTQTLLGVSTPRVGDLDADGLPDLVYPLPESNASRWVAVAGRPNPAWRQLGTWTAAGDCNADGVDDLLGQQGDRLTVRSGTTTERLWSSPAAFSTPADVLVPHAENSFPETPPGPFVFASVIVWKSTTNEVKTPQRTYAAFDRATGRQVWTSADLDLSTSSRSGGTTAWAYEYPAAGFADLDRDGFPDILAVYSPNGNPPRLSVVDGQTGRVRWESPLLDGAFSLDPRPAGMPLADFNRDGILDVALILPPVDSDKTSPSFRAQVLDGATGQPLWPESVPLATQAQQILWPEPTLGDLDGDGTPEMAVMLRSDHQPGIRGYRCELRVLDGASGQVRWSWAWSIGYPELWPAVFLRQPGLGNNLLALGITRPNEVVVQILDAAGRLRAERSLRAHAQTIRTGAPLWRSVDLDGDGTSELLARDGAELLALGGPNFEVLRRWPTAPASEAARLFLRPTGPEGAAAEIVLWHGRRLEAIDGVTGQPTWRSHAPSHPVLQLPDDRQVQWVNLGRTSPRLGVLFGPRFRTDDSTSVHTPWPCPPTTLP